MTNRLLILCFALALAINVGYMLVGLASIPAYYERVTTQTVEPYVVGDRTVISNELVAKEAAERGLSLSAYAVYQAALNCVMALVPLAVAAVVVWRARRQWFAWYTAFLIVFLGAYALVDQVYVAQLIPLQWYDTGAIFWFLLLPYFYLFPNGKPAPHRALWLVGALTLYHIIIQVLGVLVTVAPDLVAGLTWINGNVIWVPVLLNFFIVFVCQVYRYLRVSSPIERQQTKWFVAGFGLMVATVPVSVFTGLNAGFLDDLAEALLLLLLPVTIAIAILRYRLWDIDVIINRTLVYGALTASVVGIYVLIVGYLGAVLRTENDLFVSLLATGLVAVLFAPLRERLQRAVNRLMYGERDDPYAVVTRLGQRLEATLAPDAVLPTIVETVREALKLPYAAIALTENGAAAPRVAASVGEPVEKPLRLALAYQGEPVGELLLGPRAPGEAFTPADRRLLEGLARQAGVAAHAVRLTTDLQRSRERLVAAREEERRRLRRDLHDGLGAQLAGLNVQAGTLRRLIGRDPEAAEELVVELRDELRGAIADIRRLVYDLRPPALDDLGLLAALHQLAERYGSEGGQLRVLVETTEDLPPLPAAVEVAVYRIAQEALTNVVRHARAKCCVVRLAVDEDVTLDIFDDGVGIPAGRSAGVGLSSMRERARELGGTCVIEPAPEGGTRVSVCLPLPKE